MNLHRTLAVTVMASIALWFAAPAAIAHDVLIESNPESGSTINELPSEFYWRFSDEISAVGVAAVVNQGQKTVARLTVTTDGPEMTAPAPALAAGSYTIAWRVVSSDGHPVDGEISFELLQDSDPNSSGTPGDSTDDGGTDGATATDDAPSSSDPTAAAPSGGADNSAAGTPAEDDSSDSGRPWVLIAVLVAVLLVAGAALAVSTRRRGQE